MRLSNARYPAQVCRKKRGNRGSSKQSCGATEWLRNVIKLLHRVMLLANGGVAPQQAEEEKVPNAVSVDTFILFLFRLSNKARQNRTLAKRYLERGGCLLAKRYLERGGCLSPKCRLAARRDGKGECTRRDKARCPTKRHGVAGACRGENRFAENS